MSKNSRPVYSTEAGRLCPECGMAQDTCQCSKKIAVSGDGKVRVGRETSGRKGKGVTVVSGLPLEQDELKALAKQLKQLCGSGGSVRDGVIEIQGEKRDIVVKELISMGYDAKKSGA